MNHLEKSERTYYQHLFEAIFGGFKLILTGLVSILHGLFPSCFEQYVSSVIIGIYYRHFHLHPSPDVQQIIASEKQLMERKKSIRD